MTNPVSKAARGARRESVASADPTEADFDDMHHALGRPVLARANTYRNYYCTDANGPTAQRFEALGWWDFGHTINAGKDAIYHVNGAGKQALAAWLTEQQRKAGTRPYIVSGRRLTRRTVVAKSASAAKYSVYLDVRDTHEWDGGFVGFLSACDVRARIAA